MFESDFDRLAKRVESIYGEQRQQPQHPAVFVVEPLPTAKPTELDEARALIVSFLRSIPEMLLTLAALQLLLFREGWRWLRSWRRMPKEG